MVTRMASNIKLCRLCRHLIDSYPRLLSSILPTYGIDKPMKIITLECSHWFDEQMDDLERELDND